MKNELLIAKYEKMRKDAMTSAKNSRGYAKKYDMMAKASKDVIKKLRDSGVDFDSCYVSTDTFTFAVKDHSQALKLCGVLGSFVGRKWNKNVEYTGNTLSFQGKSLDGIDFHISGVKPGENCRIEYVDVEVAAVPAHIVKKPKIVCEVKSETIKVE